MTCKCICHCSNQAGGRVGAPELCIGCALADELNDETHGMPFVPQPAPKLDPLEPITDAQKDAALENWAAEQGI